MNNCRLRKLSPRLWPLFLVASIGAGLAQDGSWGGFWLEKSNDDDYWPKHFRVGAMAGLNLKADFRMSGTFAVSGSNPGTIQNGTDHYYDDGYVRVDENPLHPTDFWTSYWGYNSAGQVSGTTLSYHSAHTFTANGSSSATGDVQPGLDIVYGTHLFNWGDALIGWELGLGWLETSIEDNNPVTISATRTVHNYDTGTIVVPSAPYNGGPSGIGPNIKNIPTAQGDQTISGTVSGHTLDVSIYSVRLGPTVYWELPWNFATQLSAGAAVGFVSGELKYNETLLFDDGSRAYNRGGVSDDQFVYGGYLSATLMFHVEEHGDFYLGVNYMPMSSATFSGGGREASLNMSGAVYISAGINWPF